MIMIVHPLERFYFENFKKVYTTKNYCKRAEMHQEYVIPFRILLMLMVFVSFSVTMPNLERTNVKIW